MNKAIKRGKFLERFANRARCVIGMEACGGAHHWARRMREWKKEDRAVMAISEIPGVGLLMATAAVA